MDSLKNNPVLEYDEHTDTLCYKRQEHLTGIHDYASLVKTVNANPGVDGYSFRELKEDEPYAFVAEDAMMAIEQGDIIGVKHAEKREISLHARGHPFYSQLSGRVVAKANQARVSTTVDLRSEIRRGDLLVLSPAGPDHPERFVCRVSVAGYKSKGLEGNHVPFSASSVADRKSKLEVFSEEFTANWVPLSQDYPEGAPEGELYAFKMGCTNDIRQLWAEHKKPYSVHARELDELLVSHGLMEQSLLDKLNKVDENTRAAELRRKKLEQARVNKAKKKKRRRRMRPESP